LANSPLTIDIREIAQKGATMGNGIMIQTATGGATLEVALNRSAATRYVDCFWTRGLPAFRTWGTVAM